jgi:ABC-type dipeptide/oligopeptide/nickel transport system permease subunit
MPGSIRGFAMPRRKRAKAGFRLWLSAGWLAIVVIAAVFAPFLAPHDPLAQDLMTQMLPPAWQAGADPAYWLGTDSLGRDVLSRTIYAARIALIVAAVAATLACLTGTILGLVSGFFGGWTRLSSGIVFDFARCRAGYRPSLRHLRYRRHRLDQVLPGGAG